MTLHEVLKNTGYDLSLFSEEARRFVENGIFVKTVRGKDKPFITCLKRNKEIALKPEETVRQLYLYKLIHEYGYPASQIEVEFPIHFGREVKRPILPSWIRTVRWCPTSSLSSRSPGSAMGRSS